MFAKKAIPIQNYYIIFSNLKIDFYFNKNLSSYFVIITILST